MFHRNGKAIRNFRRAWLSARTAAACPGARTTSDATAVRNLVRAGVPETVAMQMTGHKTRSVFMQYDIVSEGDRDAAAMKLNEAMTGTISGTIGRPPRNRPTAQQREPHQAKRLALRTGP